MLFGENRNISLILSDNIRLFFNCSVHETTAKTHINLITNF
jgi:hypothetical protein